MISIILYFKHQNLITLYARHFISYILTYLGYLKMLKIHSLFD